VTVMLFSTFILYCGARASPLEPAICVILQSAPFKCPAQYLAARGRLLHCYGAAERKSRGRK
jgi:hypothetical protein